jgi:hypothetical protein
MFPGFYVVTFLFNHIGTKEHRCHIERHFEKLD